MCTINAEVAKFASTVSDGHVFDIWVPPEVYKENMTLLIGCVQEIVSVFSVMLGSTMVVCSSVGIRRLLEELQSVFLRGGGFRFGGRFPSGYLIVFAHSIVFSTS